MKNIKQKISLLLVIVMIFSSTIVLGEMGDMWTISDNKLFKTVDEILQDDTLIDLILQNTSNYGFESKDGKVYKFEDVIEAFEQDEDNFLDLLEEDYEAILELTPLELATNAVNALFVDEEDDPKELKLKVGQDEIDAAEILVDKLEDVEEKTALKNLIEEAQIILNEIENRIKSIEVIGVSNKAHDGTTSGKTWLLGYGMKLVYKPEGTASIKVEFYKDEEILGTMTARDVSDPKHDGWTTGTMDLYGDYVSTSWDHNWTGELTDIPTAIKALVGYEDDRVVEKVEKLEFEDSKITPFFVEALNRTETAEAMSTAIIELETLENMETKFTNLSETGKLKVAERVLEVRNEEPVKDEIASTEGKFSLLDNSTYEAVTTAIAKAGLVANRAELDAALADEEVEIITLANDNYGEHIKIGREVKLIAENTHRVVLEDIEIASDGVHIEGFTSKYISFGGFSEITIANNVITEEIATVGIGAGRGQLIGPVTITDNILLNGSIGLYPITSFDKYTITGNTIEKAPHEAIWLSYVEEYKNLVTLIEADEIAEKLLNENEFGEYFDGTNVKVKVKTDLFERLLK